MVEELGTTRELIIRQKKEWGEILTGFETRNRYVVMNKTGKEMYLAAEESSAILRLFLKSLRPLTLHVMKLDGTRLLRIERPFRLFLHKVSIFSSDGKPLGKIQQHFSILRRYYSVLDNSGNEVYRLFGPLLHPWTFIIQKNGREIGKIVKRWSGLLKEAFTDADNFGIEFPAEASAIQKSILLGAVFLIDFVHFEK